MACVFVCSMSLMTRQMISQLIFTSISGRQVACFLDQFVKSGASPQRYSVITALNLSVKAMFFWNRESGVNLGFIQLGKPT